MKNLKRLGALLLAIAMVCTMLITACATEEDAHFADVPVNSWYAEAVEYCREHRLMNGTATDRFEPNGTMTRAMLATALYRQAGEPAVAGTDNFTDTTEGAWYSNAVLWASQNGIINGYGKGLFGANDPVSREQIVTILWRMADSPAVENSEPFADQSSISTYAVTAVAWAREHSIVSGQSGNRFDPKGNATRAEVAVILANHAKATDAPLEVTPLPGPFPSQGSSTGGLPAGGSSSSGGSPAPTPTPTPEPADAHILVAYFSATNNTESIANHIKTILGEEADLYEIVPETPYTSADLSYTTDCRANREQNDSAARPAISGSVDNMEQYDVIFLGYPIWWGQAPKIMYTFVETYDLAGKTIVPFCTSGSSPIGSSAANLATAATGATWLSGQRFSGSAAQSTVANWVNGLNLSKTGPELNEEGTNRLYIQVSGAQDALWTATLVENSSTAALKELLKTGPLTIQMHDYGSMEKVGPIGQSLSTNNQQITTGAGDIILYQGNNLVIYYDTNSWNFTRLGKVDDVTQSEMKTVFGPGDVTVTLSLTVPNA